MITVGSTRVALTVVTMFAWFAAGQRITTIQLDGTQYYISRMNPYSAELNYFLAYEYCRSIGLQLASFETLEKTNSISDFLRNAGYNKFDYWTSGNRLGTDMLIWMSTGLPFNTTFSQMKRPNPDNNGLDNEDLKMNARPELPIARKKRGESGSRDGCVAIKAPNMDWVTADCTDLKDFICEQTRCYYYNYGSIPVSSSQGFGYKQKATAFPIHSNVSLEENTTTPTTTTTTTTTTNPITTTTPAITSTTTPVPSTIMFTTSAVAAAEGYVVTDIRRKSEVDDNNDNDAPREAEPELELTVSTTSGPVVDDLSSASTLEPLQSGYQESQTDEQQSTNEPRVDERPSTEERADSQYYTTELPTLIQMHNQQQHEQQEHDQQLHRHYQPHEMKQRGKQEIDRRDQQQHNDAYAFESLEKAFATAVPHKIRSTKDLEQPKDVVAAAGDLQLPWSWAKDIMLQKPVLKKSSQEVA
ncbi:lateral signaling target protein 2 isoform X1 [Aphis craccivora]|uniref:Lateral signaling target protein 2 isoform X1 n=1 Tax=Aphis craccivora TaxID=307492 RepID=A0A6G0Z128_APHCR|nr:lateral signaling target protein 2 isoform X1 [Aphis craccivora]